jgi:hypothetical protein
MKNHTAAPQNLEMSTSVTLKEELCALAPKPATREATAAETDELIEELMSAARRAARQGLTHAAVLLDQFVRHDAGQGALPRIAISALERHFSARGLPVVFSNDLVCVWCIIKKCGPGKHYGYILEWT